MEQALPSSSFISTVQLEREDEELAKPRSFDAIIEERSSNSLLLTTILEDRMG